ncbi:MAG: glycoside hydrolase family 38 C-terminal domain-containing protein [Armatimonadota bacterium]|nr:glycoside hydrolase family 38 C-terminal domain-containing protein [Armatimonadota bacterium]
MAESLDEIRRELDGRELLVVPYCHADWAWTHSRRWHAVRYTLAIDEVLDIMAAQDEAGVSGDAPEAYRWYTDCYRTQIVPFLQARPEREAELRRRIAEGRIAICGGYANVRINHVPGELFVRGMVLGRREWERLFPEAELTVHSDIVDVAVGHPQLPQLLRLAGYRSLQFWRPEEALNAKGIPHHFVWEGLDGTRVLAARGCYGGLNALGYAPENFAEGWDETVRFWWENLLEYKLQHSPADLLWLQRGADDARPLRTNVASDEPMDLPGLIRAWNDRESSSMRFATPVEAFRLLEQRREELPVVSGTLDPCDVAYNAAWGGSHGLWRLRQEAAREIGVTEMLEALGAASGATDADPDAAQERLDDLWRDALLFSAHATQWLFEEDFGELYALAQSTVTRARREQQQVLRSLSSRIDCPEDAAEVLVNPLPREREVTVPLRVTFVRGERPGAPEPMRLIDGAGREVPWQLLRDLRHANATWECDVLARVTLPPGGWTVLRWEEAPPAEDPGPAGEASAECIEADLLSLHFDRGRLMRIEDRAAGREWLAPQHTPFGHLRIYDVDTTAPLHVGPILGRTDAVWERWGVIERGPLRWSVRCEGAIGACPAAMEVRLYRGQRRVEFAVEVEWDGRGGFLASHLPWPGPGELFGDMPFCVEPTPLDDEPYVGIERAREGMFIARSFVDHVGDGGSIAYLSHDGDRYFIRDRERSTLAHILINSVREPYAEWEESVNRTMRGKGLHRFTFSLVPHEGDWRDGGLWRLSEELRTPVLQTRPLGAGDLPMHGELLAVEPGNVSLTACYADAGRVLVRLCELHGTHTEAMVRLPFEAAEAALVDLAGHSLDARPPRVDGRTVALPMSPHQIATLALTVEEESS